MILRSAYIDGLIREYEESKPARGERVWDALDLEFAQERLSDAQFMLDLWCRKGCPRKMFFRLGRETIIFLNGSRMSDSENTEAPIINNLQGDAKAPPHPYPSSGDAKGWCAVCGQPFPPVRSTGKYCSPRCRRTAYRSRQKKAIRARLAQEREYAKERNRLKLRD